METPVLRSLIQLSSAQSLHPADESLTRDETANALRVTGIEYIVLNRGTSPAALIDYVERKLPLQLLGVEGDRELYAVAGEASVPRRPASSK
jgi:hypothetical protein